MVYLVFGKILNLLGQNFKPIWDIFYAIEQMLNVFKGQVWSQ